MAKKKTLKKSKSGPDAKTFEQSLAELERIVKNLERGDLGLEEALSQYEDGVKHLRACHQLLARAERKIEVLCGMDSSGNPITQPLELTVSESLTDKAAARGQRRTHAQHRVGSEICADEDDVDEDSRLF